MNWVSVLDHELQSMSCEMETAVGIKYVTKFKCRICIRYKEKVIGQWNFSSKWIEEADFV